MAQEVNLINSGTTKYGAEVDANGRVHVAALTESQSTASHLEGYGYNWNTEILTLTTANNSALLYVRNDSVNDPLVIELQLLHVAGTTGGAGAWTVQTYKNILDTSTIVSNAVKPVMDGINYNAGSADTPSDIVAFAGAEGATVVGGVKNLFSLKTVGAWGDAIPTSIILNAGENICVTMTPPTGNTSMDVMAVFSGFHLHGTVTV